MTAAHRNRLAATTVKDSNFSREKALQHCSVEKLGELRENIRCAAGLLVSPTPERVAQCDVLLQSTASVLEQFQNMLAEVDASRKQQLKAPAWSLRREIDRLRTLLDGARHYFLEWSKVSSEAANSYDEQGRSVTFIDGEQSISVKG